MMDEFRAMMRKIAQKIKKGLSDLFTAALRPLLTEVPRAHVRPDPVTPTFFMQGLRRGRLFFRTLSRREGAVFALGLFLIAAGLTWGARSWYRASTTLIPRDGGIFTEGIVGSPQYINPVLTQIGSVDQSLSSLIFAGLMRYNAEGELVDDLAESHAIGEEGRVFEFLLRENLFWHDGKPLTSDDVMFTVNMAQDARFKNPFYQNWLGVSAEALDGRRIRFTLQEPYAPFLANTTLGILPKHLWQNVMPENAALNELNIKPIGAGPFRAVRFEKDENGFIVSYTLKPHAQYHGRKPRIAEVRFRFFLTHDEALSALYRKKIDAFGGIDPEDLANFRGEKNIAINRAPQARYLALFLNQTQSKALADKTVRVALAYAVNKTALIETLKLGEARIAETPILPGLFGYTTEIKIYDFAPDHAKNILDAAGWRDSDNDGIREKQGEKLSIKIATLDSEELRGVAEELKTMFAAIGAETIVEATDGPTLRQTVIKERTYQSLLFGIALNLDPDPLSFWHSSQRLDPGLNLALYDNKRVDALLEEARKTFDESARTQKYVDFQKILADDVPAIFLYSPNFIYAVSARVHNVVLPSIIGDPAARFANANEWYINTERVWK